MAGVPGPAPLGQENPFRTALGLEVAFPAPGEAEIAAPLAGGNLAGDGRIAPGVLLTLLDVALGHAIASRLPAATSFATVSLQVLVAENWPAQPCLAWGVAHPIAQDWRDTIATGRVVSGGRVVATAQGSFARGQGSRTALGPGPAVPAAWRDFRELLGYSLTGESVVARVEHHHLNAEGVMHGGAVAALLDEAMCAGLASAGAGAVRLASFAVRYILPARPGTVTATWEVQRRGRRIHFAAARLRDGDGNLLAVADATYVEEQA